MLTSTAANFSHLSLKDLIEAREMFHAHLINKKNVVATALGRYLIRIDDIDKSGKYNPKKYDPKKGKPARTLDNSTVIDISWPCILTFVDNWESKESLISAESTDVVPSCVYMPDGRVVPICVVLAPKNPVSDDDVNKSALRFPDNLVGGGFPVIINSQNQDHIASIGCIVTDGHTYYALTNKHVSGTADQLVETIIGFSRVPIGRASGISLGKVKFEKLYPGWPSEHMLVSCDVGLIRIDDINIWKTDILGFDRTDELFDLNTINLSLNIIAEHTKENDKLQPSLIGNVVAHGGVSGKMEAEIRALFYRYRSVGGVEYLSDFLIGGRMQAQLPVHHGDSGTVWLLETFKNDVRYLNPIALHWGQHMFFQNNGKFCNNFSLATSLSNVCRELDVELVRGWNIDNDFSWGKTGHFKIAAAVCDLVTTPKLKKLLKANLDRISFTDADMKAGKMKNAKWGEFVPMADVPDIIWRMNRKDDEANHFADMDEKNKKVFDNRDLLEICEDPANVDIDVWNQYYEDMEAIDSTKSPNKRGALPFRVWQAYLGMVQCLKNKDIEGFIFIGGTVSHYLGDACQPLHVSFLHHGHPGVASENAVHSTYETTMLDRNQTELFVLVNAALKKGSQTFKPYTGAKKAALKTIALMSDVITNILSPEEIIDMYNETGTTGRVANMWTKLKTKTVKCIVAGTRNLGLFWESAWAEGGGNNAFASADLVAIDPDALTKLYMDKTKFPSFKLIDPKYKDALAE
jgi:hypothetical protein